MRNLFRYVGFRHLRMRPVRTLLTVLGVALGIALYVAIDVINRSTLASFRESVDAVAGKATLVVSAGETGFQESAVKTVQAVAGVRHAVPLVESRAYFAGSGQASETLVVLGVDLLKEQAVRTYKTADEEIIEDPLVFMNQPDSIIITHAFARDHALRIDSPLDLATAHGRKRFTVRGLLSPEGPAKAYGGAIAIMDIDGAQVSFGKAGKYDRIDIVTRGEADVAKVAAELRAKLGPAFTVERPESQSENMERMVRAFQEILVFFGVLALLVGLFLISNAITIAVAERRREIGTLRSLGASRPGILGLFLSEAVVIGAVGALAGGFMGRGLASLMLNLVTHSLSTQNLSRVSVSHLNFSAGDVLHAVGIGIGSCFLAALWPSLRATLVHPLEAMRRSDVGEDGRSTGFFRWSPYVGALMLAYLVAATRFNWGEESSLVLRFNQLCAMMGSALIGPALVGKLLAAYRLVFRSRGGVIMRLAEGNLARNPRRTGTNITSLMVGLMLVITIATVNQSFKTTIRDLFDRLLSADLLITSNGSVAALQVQPLHESLAAEIAKVGELEPATPHTVSAMRLIHLRYADTEIVLKAYDAPDPRVPHWQFDVHDRPSAEATNDLFHGAGFPVFVSENFVMHFGKRTGDSIGLATPSGPVTARIAGVVSDYASPQGVVYVARDRYKRLWRDSLVSVFAVKVRPGVDPARARLAIDRQVGSRKNLMVTSSVEFKRQIVEMVDQSFGYTRAIESAALLIALLGLLNTLLVSVIERMREFGMLRAVGMSRLQLSAMILQEALIQGGFGAVAAVVFGVGVAYLWTTHTLAQILGWIIHFHFPWMSIATTVLTGTIVALLAGLYPSYKAANIEIREALEYE